MKLNPSFRFHADNLAGSPLTFAQAGLEILRCARSEARPGLRRRFPGCTELAAARLLRQSRTIDNPCGPGIAGSLARHSPTVWFECLALPRASQAASRASQASWHHRELMPLH